MTKIQKTKRTLSDSCFRRNDTLKSQICKAVLSFAVFVAVTSLILGINIAFAQGVVPIDVLSKMIEGSSTTGDASGGSGLTKFAGKFHKQSSVEPGADLITSVVFYVIDFAKYLLGGIAVLYFMFAGFKLVTAEAKIDEESEKQKQNMKYIIYGLILVIIADELVTKVFFGEYGECLASASNAKECAKGGSTLIKGLYSFVFAIIATLAVFVLVLSGFRLATSAGEEETINKQKRHITMAILGILISGIAEFAIKGIIFPEGGQKGIDVAKAQKLVANFTNFISAFIGAAAFAMLFYGGYLYVVSAGNEEKTGKAKKIILGAIIGIIIAIAAYGIVATITNFDKGWK